MAVTLDHQLPSHPKVVKAAASLGGQTALARVLALFVDMLCYSDAYLTDGKVPRVVVARSKVTPQPLVVARALTNAHLLHRVNGGYQIHDYSEYNKTATEIKANRKAWRDKKRAQRRTAGGTFSSIKPGLFQNVPRGLPRESHRTRARGTGTSTQISLTRDPGTSTVSEITARSARGILKFPERKTTHRILCAMLRAELAEEASLANAIEGVKVRCARQGFAYPDGAQLDAAIQAVERATTKRRA